MDFVKLILEASFVVQLVIIVLVFFSIFSWAVIFFKRRTLKKATSHSVKFLAVFRRSRNLTDVNEAARK